MGGMSPYFPDTLLFSGFKMAAEIVYKLGFVKDGLDVVRHTLSTESILRY